jgi:hypothetical protein
MIVATCCILANASPERICEKWPKRTKNTGAISWGDRLEVTLQSFVGMFVPIAPFCLRKGSSLIAPGKNGPGEWPGPVWVST